MDLHQDTDLVVADPPFQLDGATYGDRGPFPLGTIPAGSRDCLLRMGWIKYCAAGEPAAEAAVAAGADTPAKAKKPKR